MQTASQAYQAHTTAEGVAFMVDVDYVKYECLITDEALQKLALLGKKDSLPGDNLKIYHAHAPRINGIARRLVAAGIKGIPLRVNANSFTGGSI